MKLMTQDKNEQLENGDDKDRRKRSRYIGSKLRQLYDEVTKEQVPEEFLRILDEADRNHDSDR